MVTSEQIAIGAGVISLLSMLIAWRSYRLAKSSFLLTQKEHKDRYHDIDAYLVQAVKRKKDSSVYCSFAISYTNQATLPSSLKNFILEIEYYDKNGIFHKIKIDSEIENQSNKVFKSLKNIDVPLNLESKGTTSGWVSFKLPLSLQNIKVNIYRVCAYTPSDEGVCVQAYLLTMVEDEKI